MKKNYPYEKFQKTKIWKKLNAAIEDLVANNDIKENTERAYIVGYLCKKLEMDDQNRSEKQLEKRGWTKEDVIETAKKMHIAQ
jgi:hypothetical protein